jgi:hypothetical protein
MEVEDWAAAVLGAMRAISIETIALKAKLLI